MVEKKLKRYSSKIGKISLIIPVLLLVVGVSLVAAQNTDSTGAFASIVDKLQRTSQGWFENGFDIAQVIFGLLVVLELIIWGWNLWTKEKTGAGFLSKDLVQKMIFFAVVGTVMFLYKGVLGIITEFIGAGQNMTGIYDTVNPSTIIHMGENVWLEITTAKASNFLENWMMITFEFTKTIWTIMIGFAVYIGFIVISIQYMYLIVETTIVGAAGILFMGFLPFRVTRPLGEGMLTYITNLAIKNFFFYIILGGMMGVMELVIENIENMSTINYYPLMEMVSIVFLTVFLLGKLPGKMGDKLTRDFSVSFDKIVPQMEAYSRKS